MGEQDLKHSAGPVSKKPDLDKLTIPVVLKEHKNANTDGSPGLSFEELNKLRSFDMAMAVITAMGTSDAKTLRSSLGARAPFSLLPDATDRKVTVWHAAVMLSRLDPEKADIVFNEIAQFAPGTHKLLMEKLATSADPRLAASIAANKSKLQSDELLGASAVADSLLALNPRARNKIIEEFHHQKMPKENIARILALMEIKKPSLTTEGAQIYTLGDSGANRSKSWSDYKTLLQQNLKSLMNKAADESRESLRKKLERLLDRDD